MVLCTERLANPPSLDSTQLPPQLLAPPLCSLWAATATGWRQHVGEGEGWHGWHDGNDVEGDGDRRGEMPDGCLRHGVYLMNTRMYTSARFVVSMHFIPAVSLLCPHRS